MAKRPAITQVNPLSFNASAFLITYRSCPWIRHFQGFEAITEEGRNLSSTLQSTAHHAINNDSCWSVQALIPIEHTLVPMPRVGTRSIAPAQANRLGPVPLVQPPDFGEPSGIFFVLDINKFVSTRRNLTPVQSDNSRVHITLWYHLQIISA